MQYNPFYYLESVLRILIVVGALGFTVLFAILFGYYILYKPITTNLLYWGAEQVFGGAT